MLRGDLVSELRFALAEADADDTSERLRLRVFQASIDARAQGRPGEPAEHIDGAETLRRTVGILDALLHALCTDEWSRPALRDLDAQGLIGHLIGVETSFLAVLDGDTSAAQADHVASTQPSALGQAERDPSETLEEWRQLAARGLERANEEPPDRVVTFYGVELPLTSCWSSGPSRCGSTTRTSAAPPAGRSSRWTPPGSPG